MQTLEMELFLDTYEAHSEGSAVLNEAGSDVRDLTRKVTDLMSIDRTTHAPPVLLFVWGSLSFTCVLARATQKFIMFRPDGTPVRATAPGHVQRVPNVDLEAKEIKRETADYSKTMRGPRGRDPGRDRPREYGDADALAADRAPQRHRPTAFAAPSASG